MTQVSCLVIWVVRQQQRASPCLWAHIWRQPRQVSLQRWEALYLERQVYTFYASCLVAKFSLQLILYIRYLFLLLLHVWMPSDEGSLKSMFSFTSIRGTCDTTCDTHVYVTIYATRRSCRVPPVIAVLSCSSTVRPKDRCQKSSEAFLYRRHKLTI
jgi:hypothetical protein